MIWRWKSIRYRGGATYHLCGDGHIRAFVGLTPGANAVSSITSVCRMMMMGVGG